MTEPTHRELSVLAATLTTGRIKSGAATLRISEHTARNHLAALYAKLGVQGMAEAAVRLGWTKIPDDLGPFPPLASCGWRGYCSRWQGHGGHHGGFRAV